MYPVSELFAQYIAQPDREFEVKAVINGTTYDDTVVVDFDIDDSLIPSSTLTLGTTICSRLNISMRTSATIAANATIAPWIRLKCGAVWSEWVPMGVFYVDSRAYQNGLWKFTCYDRLMLMNQLYVSALTYPQTMVAVMNEISGQIGMSLDSTVVINSAYEIPYKDEDITIRDMVSYIASAHGASARATKDEKLGWVLFSTASPKPIPPALYFKCENTNAVKTFSKVEVTYNTDGEVLTSGTGDADTTVTFYNQFITQAQVDAVKTLVNGFSYQPLVMSWKGNPSVEIGDRLAITQMDTSVVNTTVLQQKLSFKGGLSATVTSPSDSAQKSEFDYKGKLNKIIRESAGGLKEDEPYYGVTIGRANGLKIEKSDGKSKVILNSDFLKWQVERLGSMVDALYFDAVAGNLKFNGLFGVDAIEALKAEIDVVISNTTITNILAAGTADIAQLTVDRLETSDKVQRYKASDTTDLNYVRAQDQTIEFITASVASGTSQAEDRFGSPLYWTDANKTQADTVVTEWPVTVYNYTENTKMVMEFYNDGTNYIPRIVLGTGSGQGGNGKGYIYKIDGGIQLTYLAYDSSERTILLHEDGLKSRGGRANGGIVNVYPFGATITNPQHGDLRIVTAT